MKPDYLKAKDTIGIVAPARQIAESEVMPTVNFLEKHGFCVEFGQNLFKQHHQFAGLDEERVADMQYMLNAPHIKAIFSARGGYGSARIIDKLDFSAFIEKPKWLCGYSDFTVFHSHIHTLCQIPTLHTFMPVNLTDATCINEEVTTFLKAIKGETLEYYIPHHNLNRSGKAEGVLVGGNLSVIYSLLGSPSDIDTDGKILFLEDLDEYLYHIDRMMLNLKRNGKLENLAGLLIGTFSDMHDNEIPYGKIAEEIIAEHCAEYNFPICFNFPAGHLSPNCALKLGEPTTLTVKHQQQSHLKFL